MLSANTCLISALVVANAAVAQRFHLRSPNDYKQTADDNAATLLNARLERGEITLAAEGRSGRLRALLRALSVPESSQMLVFSKTSLQRHRISPQNPRAVYFGPDTYVGWVPGAAALEVAVGDPKLGIAFYKLPQGDDVPPRLERDDSCLRCHASTYTEDEPGLVLRSVFPDEGGDPIAGAGEADVSMRAPMVERWGGWIVTGHFAGEHRGNGIAFRGEDDRWQVHSQPAEDLNAFAADFKAEDYPMPTSDIGALLALEQQVTLHNVLVRSMLQMRCLQEGDAALNEMLGESGEREQTARIADRLAKEITEQLLMGREASLAERDAAPLPAFARDFAALWPRDANGTRLGQLDLRQRLFVLPMSPMVHSPAFARLPDALRERVLVRLRKALARGRLPAGVTMTREQREVLDAHLAATLPGYGK
ncbi:MAG: hypothetical protein KDC98_26335 [Planctomycetes bacterium]|nr:hypothetical protein [Planctomycetota bacterium]